MPNIYAKLKCINDPFILNKSSVVEIYQTRAHLIQDGNQME